MKQALIFHGTNGNPDKYWYQADTLYISALTAHLVVHFGQAIVHLPIVRQFLGDYTVLGLENADFNLAFNNVRGNNFEDGLQLAVAIRNGCTHFSTFDTDLVARYQDLPSIQVQRVI